MPGHWSLRDGVLIETSDILRMLIEKNSYFNWFQFFDNDQFVGQSKSPSTEILGIPYHYIVVLTYHQEKDSFQFSISHDKFFVGFNTESSCRFIPQDTEFMLAKELMTIIKQGTILPIYFNLFINGEWREPLEGLHTFLTSLP